MAAQLSNPMYDLLKESGLYRFARLWKVTRADAVEMNFTDHDVPLVFDGDTYSPAGGFESSASQSLSALRPQNAELLGVLDSSYITSDDLRNGVYDYAVITTWIVDWRYPWAGVDGFKKEILHLTGIEYTDHGWQAQVAGQSHLLLQKKGKVVTRNCTAQLGDAECQVDMGPLTVTNNTVDAIISGYTRSRFRSDLSAAIGANELVDEDGVQVNDQWYRNGKIIWTLGNNTGQTNHVQRFTEVDGVVWLWDATHNPIVAGDKFTAIPGCDKTPNHCKLKFRNAASGDLGNIIEFRGFPFVPGITKQQQSPANKS